MVMTEPKRSDEVERAKKSSVAQLLFKCARLVNERTIARANQVFGTELRTAHTSLFPHIDLVSGTRLTTLAERLGVSKQAVGQLVDELVDMGMLERRPDLEDGRAKRICFPIRRRHGALEGLDVLRDEEEVLRAAIGAQRFRALHAGLLALERVLEEGEVLERDGEP
jgi:DNA-binding transcriptional ArsR family regulator